MKSGQIFPKSYTMLSNYIFFESDFYSMSLKLYHVMHISLHLPVQISQLQLNYWTIRFIHSWHFDTPLANFRKLSFRILTGDSIKLNALNLCCLSYFNDFCSFFRIVCTSDDDRRRVLLNGRQKSQFHFKTLHKLKIAHSVWNNIQIFYFLIITKKALSVFVLLWYVAIVNSACKR